MNKEILKTSLILLLVVLVIGGALWFSNYKKTHEKLPYYTVNMTSDEFTFEEKPPEDKVGDFSFINQKGEVITQQKLGECVYVADYIYTTCPGICKIMTRKMSKVYNEFKDEPRFKILSHTSKPEEDSIATLMQYALMNGADNSDKWIFLTGDPKELQRMAYKEYGIVNPEDLQPEGSFVHTEMFVLVDKDKYIRGYYDGTDSLEVAKLINDIHSLLNQ